MNRKLLIATVGLLVLSGPASATLGVRASVTLTGPDLRVNDIFGGISSTAVVGSAPAPGKRLILDHSALLRIARANGIRWQPRNYLVRTVVTRESRVMDQAEIEDALRRALVARGLPQDRKLELANRSVSIHVASNLVTPFTIENPVYDDKTGRASAILAVQTDGADVTRHRLESYIYTVMDIPVLNRRIRRGEKIDAGDVIWKSLRKDTVGRNIVLDRDAVVGQAARRYLQVGQALSQSDLEPPTVIRKGSLVTVMFRARGLRLTAKARASEDGAVNETIRVVNLRSNRSIDVVVHGPSTVIIPNVITATN